MPRTRRASSAGADSDDERTTAPIFTPVLPPRLTSTSHAALVKWRGERHRTALSRQHVQDLQKLDSSVVVQALPTPIINSTVGDGEIECSASAQLRLLLNTAGGPVALNDPIECLIIEDREPEFILGQDVLLSLGIDVDRQLEQLAVRTEDEDGGEDD
ncbi:hypothetical protein GQ600_14836 [Phytophthora cactorum]|nr:hypothetical protein GQ600_14836 [Phytophthora cactorum]